MLEGWNNGQCRQEYLLGLAQDTGIRVSVEHHEEHSGKSCWVLKKQWAEFWRLLAVDAIPTSIKESIRFAILQCSWQLLWSVEYDSLSNSQLSRLLGARPHTPPTKPVSFPNRCCPSIIQGENWGSQDYRGLSLSLNSWWEMKFMTDDHAVLAQNALKAFYWKHRFTVTIRVAPIGCSNDQWSTYRTPCIL